MSSPPVPDDNDDQLPPSPEGAKEAPKTPAKTKAPEQSYHSTPVGVSGIASREIGENYGLDKKADIEREVVGDMRKHSKGNAQDMIKALLGLVAPDADFDGCLDAAISIANSDSVKDQLKDYCEAKTEALRYAPFTNLCNLALERWQQDSKARKILPNVKVPKAADRLLFHQNDPMAIGANKDTPLQLELKPDIVAINTKTAARVHGRSKWNVLKRLAPNRPPKRFEWSEVQTWVELKKKPNSTFEPPIKPYAIDDEFHETEHIAVPRYGLETQDGLVLEEDDSNEEEPNLVAAAAFMDSRSESGQVDEISIQTPPTSDGQLHEEPESGNGPKAVDKGPKKRQVSESAEEIPDAKKARKNEKELNSKSPVVQMAFYAAERLSHSFVTTHTFGFLVIDSIMHIWWYDRQSAIQSTGFDFVKNLPYFFVVLLALQRYQPEHFGINPEFRPTDSGYTVELDRVTEDEEVDGQVTEKKKVKVHVTKRGFFRYNLFSRATAVFDAECEDSDEDVVLKAYWPDNERVKEVEIVKQALRCTGEPDGKYIKGHLPEILCSMDFEQFSTDKFRKRAKIETKDRSDGVVRALRVMVSVKLQPISKLYGDPLWKAFWECFYCHFYLWKYKIRHRDISLSNLMYNPHTKKGVLMDFDLAVTDAVKARRFAFERTGTLPFMAIDLLKQSTRGGETVHLYRHDAESFTWVLLWICGRYQGGKQVSKTFREWMEGPVDVCVDRKTAFASRHDNWKANADHESYGMAAWLLGKYWADYNNNTRVRAMEGIPDLSDEEAAREVRRVVEIQAKTPIPVQVDQSLMPR